MCKFILSLLLAFSLISPAYSAELLVHAKGHWMDDLTLSEVSKMSAGEKQSYEARSQKGDIIVVRPDGWKWGKEECLPNYIVVKLPGVPVDTAKQYEQSLIDTTDPQKPILKRIRKFAIPKSEIDNYTSSAKSVITVDKNIPTYLDSIVVKTGASNEISAPSSDLRGAVRREWELTKRFFLPYAYATTQLKKTVKPSGGDYTSLEGCMNANEKDLSAATGSDEYFDVEIDGTWSSADTTACTIHNYTTDATHYINIYTTSAARHKGIVNSSVADYSLFTSTDNSPSITISSQYVTITGLRIKNTASDNYAIQTTVNVNQANIAIKKCLIQYSVNPGLDGCDGIKLNTFSGILVCNNFIVGCETCGIKVDSDSGGSFTIENNTILACGYGIYWVDYGGYTLVTKNNLALDNSGGDYRSGLTITNNNASSDASGNVGFQNYVSTTELTDTTANQQDCHLKLGATSIDNGLDLSATFTDDIDGNTRSGTWDIGADEYVSTGATYLTPYYYLHLLQGEN